MKARPIARYLLLDRSRGKRKGVCVVYLAAALIYKNSKRLRIIRVVHGHRDVKRLLNKP